MIDFSLRNLRCFHTQIHCKTREMFLSWNVKCSLRQSINAVYMRSCCNYRSVDECIKPAWNWIQWNRERSANIIKYLYSLCVLLRSYIPWAYQAYHTLSDFVPMMSGQMIIWTKGCNKKENSHKFDMTRRQTGYQASFIVDCKCRRKRNHLGLNKCSTLQRIFERTHLPSRFSIRAWYIECGRDFSIYRARKKHFRFHSGGCPHGHQLDNLFIRLQRFFGQSWHMISQSWRRSPFKEL